MRVVGRLAESEYPVLFASYDEADKCEFIKVNARMGTWEAWSSDDGAGLLLQAGALREARDASGLSALDVARSKGRAPELVRLLEPVS